MHGSDERYCRLLQGAVLPHEDEEREDDDDDEHERREEEDDDEEQDEDDDDREWCFLPPSGKIGVDLIPCELARFTIPSLHFD